ncbi:MAG: Mor transcription activator family protein [Stenotrophomonas sp.]|uniref:Mor transcription activator family protein n=1 Tax=Stenotrophomonas sp. TaxID=69392 RepID=UPI003D6D2A96
MTRNAMEARRSELLADAAAQAADTAREMGLSQDRADQIGAAVADRLAENWSGQVLSFPKDHAFKLSLREREILAAHRDGASYSELARKYDMTERGIRKLIRRAELRDRNLNQLGLF